MKILFYVASTILLLALPAYADPVKEPYDPFFDGADNSALIHSLQSRIDRLERDMAMFQKGAGDTRHGGRASGGSLDNSTAARFEARMQALEESMHALTGRFEEADHANRVLLKELQDIKNSDAYNYGKLKMQGTQFDEKPKLSPEDKLAIPEDPEEKKKEAAATEASIKKEFDAAFQLVKQSDFPAAQEAFRKFIEAHPGHKLLSNAYFWLGETFFVKKQYEEASVQYLRGYKTAPTGVKAPDSLYKLGMALTKLGNTEQACKTFNRIYNEFPSVAGDLKLKMDDAMKAVPCG